MRKVSSSRSSCSSGSGGGSSSNSKTLLTMILSVKMFLQGGIPRSVRTRYEKIDFLYPQACVLTCVGNLQEIWFMQISWRLRRFPTGEHDDAAAADAAAADDDDAAPSGLVLLCRRATKWFMSLLLPFKSWGS